MINFIEWKKDEETKRNLGNERASAKRKTKKLLQASVGPTTGPAFACLYKEGTARIITLAYVWPGG